VIFLLSAEQWGVIAVVLFASCVLQGHPFNLADNTVFAGTGPTLRFRGVVDN